MEKSKIGRILLIVIWTLVVPVGLLYVFVPWYNKHEVYKWPFGVQSNALRVKWKMPVIEDDMSPSYHYNKRENRWDVSDEYPDDNQTLHMEKTVTVDTNTNKVVKEEDVFRRKINDTVFRELAVSYKFIGSRPYIDTGVLIYIYKSPYYLNHNNKEIWLDKNSVDSVAKKWHLDYLVKGK
jgi:hypothetical protein